VRQLVQVFLKHLNQAVTLLRISMLHSRLHYFRLNTNYTTALVHSFRMESFQLLVPPSRKSSVYHHQLAQVNGFATKSPVFHDSAISPGYHLRTAWPDSEWRSVHIGNNKAVHSGSVYLGRNFWEVDIGTEDLMFRRSAFYSCCCWF
jgi:hypothetical protein